MRECQVRICERLGVQFPGPTRHGRRFGTTHLCFSSASVSRPSADATAGLLSAKTAIRITAAKRLNSTQSGRSSRLTRSDGHAPYLPFAIPVGIGSIGWKGGIIDLTGL